MFEVDWQDYDCERVGQRRVRKEVERERKKNNDASSGHRTNSTLSTRTSSSSDQYRRNFFGSIGRKKAPASLKSTRRETSPPKFNPSKPAGEFKRGSLRFSGIAATMMEPLTASNSMGLENKLPNIRSSGTLKSTADAMQSTSPQSADRSSKESELSRMTQLTVPTLESKGDESTSDANTEIKLVQALDNKVSFVNKVIMTTPERGEADPFVSIQARVGTKITSGSRIPRKTRLSQVMQSIPSPEDNAAAKSASDLIDDWFTALHNPTARPALRPGPDGTIRSGSVLLPPNVVRRALPETPTRPQSARKSDTARFLPAKASPIRFSALDPDDWQPLTVRKKHTSSHSIRTTPAPAVENQKNRDGGDSQDEVEAEIMRLMAADLKDIHVQEEEEEEEEEEVAVGREESGASRRAADADNPRAAKPSVSAGYVGEASARSAPMGKGAAAVGRGGRRSDVRPAV